MSSSIFSNPNITPRPRLQSFACPHCNSNALGALSCGGVQVTHLENYGRWFQICIACKDIIWHSPPTARELIPEEVLTQFYYRQETAEEPKILCQEPDCSKLTGAGPRRASKQCERVPFRCAACCRRLGGCKEHPILKMSQPVEPIPGVIFPALSAAPPFQASGSQHPASAHGSSQLALAQPRTTYARNLTGGYAEGWQAAQRQKQAAQVQRQLTETATRNAQNTVAVIVWKEKNVYPKLLSVINPLPGFFIPSSIPIIVDLFKNARLVSVFRTHPRIDWFSQALNVPIIASQEVRILIRDDSFTDSDCPDLESHLEQCMSENRHIRTFGSDSLRRIPYPPVQKEADLTATSLSRTITAPILPVLSSDPQAPFPLPGAYDMIIRFQKMQLRMQGTSKADSATKLIALFKQFFPNGLFVRSSFYHAQNVYLRALEVESKVGLIQKYLNYQPRRHGTWKMFRDEVNNVNPQVKGKKLSLAPVISSGNQDIHGSDSFRDSLSPPKEPSLSPPSSLSTTFATKGASAVEKSPITVNMADNFLQGEEEEYSIRTISLDEYQMIDGQLIAFRDYPDMDMLFEETPSAQGKYKQIFAMQGPSPTDHLERAYASKSFGFNGPEWYSPAPNGELAVWLEGARLSKAHLLSFSFIALLTEKHLDFPAFEVVPTSLLTFRNSSKTSRVVQPWLSGEMFHSAYSEDTLPELCDLLKAFSHFSYTFTEGASVIHRFQGFIDKHDSILRIFDSTVHMLDSDNDCNIAFYLKNTRAIGIELFKEEHVCGSTCKALGYLPL